MPGLEKILRGILRFRRGGKTEMLEQLKEFKANPESVAVYFSCMDCRIQPSRITDTKAGDMFVVRNPGNMVPHFRHYAGQDFVTGEGGALQLGCVNENIRHVMVCSHSDCRAMSTLHGLKGQCLHPENSILQKWLSTHGGDTMEKFAQLTENASGPLRFEGASSQQDFEALIDPEKQFSETDRLSQVNCLQQLTNIASYPFMKELLIQNRVILHALWFDLNDGEVHMFSKNRKRFLRINEDNYDILMSDSNAVEAA